MEDYLYKIDLALVECVSDLKLLVLVLCDTCKTKNVHILFKGL